VSSFSLLSSSHSFIDFDEEDANDFLSSGPDLRLELSAASEPPYTVSDLERLQPEDNSWTMFQVEVIVRRSLSYDLEILMRRGSQGVIAMDDISIEYKPVLATADISIPLPENYTEPTETPDITRPNVTEAYNETTEAETTTTSSTLNITELNSSITTTTTATTTTTRTQAGNETDTHPETTTGAAVTDIQPESSQADQKTGGGDDSMYGYKGEVVLICFTVLFVVLFIMMVVKYHRLKTKFGGYDLGPESGGGRSNPAYNLQMSYRNGEGEE